MIQVARKVLSLIAIGVATSTALLAQAGVTAALPNGREIHPEGNWIPLAPYPFALAVRPDDAQIAAPSIGFSFALNVIEEPKVQVLEFAVFPRDMKMIPPSKCMPAWLTRPTWLCSTSRTAILEGFPWI